LRKGSDNAAFFFMPKLKTQKGQILRAIAKKAKAAELELPARHAGLPLPVYRSTGLGPLPQGAATANRSLLEKSGTDLELGEQVDSASTCDQDHPNAEVRGRRAVPLHRC